MINARIIGEIDDLSDIYAQIAEGEDKEVELLINSPGGSAFAAIDFVNEICKLDKDITAKVEVCAMSAAAVIALGCPKVVVDSKAIIMLHNCWGANVGNAKDLRSEADAMDCVNNALQEIVTTHCSEENAEYIKERMDDGDLWLTGKACAELFDNVELVEKAPEQGKKVADGSLADLVEKYNTLLAQFKTEAVKDAPAPEEKPPAEEEEKEEAVPDPKEDEPKDEGETPAETPSEGESEEAETPAAPVAPVKKKEDMYSAEIMAIYNEVL